MSFSDFLIRKPHMLLFMYTSPLYVIWELILYYLSTPNCHLLSHNDKIVKGQPLAEVFDHHEFLDLLLSGYDLLFLAYYHYLSLSWITSFIGSLVWVVLFSINKCVEEEEDDLTCLLLRTIYTILNLFQLFDINVTDVFPEELVGSICLPHIMYTS